jgi:hypothetical protein
MYLRLVGFLLLAAVLLQAPAAPVPVSQYPEVYALVYVGRASNDKKIAQRIAKESQDILSRCRLMDKAKGQFHVKPLQNTGVLRVWYTEGTPKEQAEIINRVLSSYDPRSEGQMKAYERHLANLRYEREEIVNSKRPDARLLDKVDEEIRWAEERNKTLPRILEWAAADSGD